MTNTILDLNEAIRASAMLVSYHTTRWYPDVHDSDAATAAAAASGADPNAYRRVMKNLMHGADSRLKTITSVQEMGRRSHNRLTLPWVTDASNSGPRLLPTVVWMDYMRAMGNAKATHDNAVEAFFAGYDADVVEAQKNLNMVGDPYHLYPSKEDLKGRFSIKLDFYPIPAGTHFRGLPPGAQKMLEDSYEERMRARMEGAIADIFVRARDVLDKLADKLDVPLGETPTFRQAVIRGVRDMVPMMRAWNLTNDERVTHLADNMDRLLGNETYETIKNNDELRNMIVSGAKALLHTMDNWEV